MDYPRILGESFFYFPFQINSLSSKNEIHGRVENWGRPVISETRSSPRNKTIGRRFRKTDSKLTSDKQGKEANARRGEAEKGERGDTARRQRESQRRAG